MTNAACSLLKYLSRFAMILAVIFLMSDRFPLLTTQTTLSAQVRSPTSNSFQITAQKQKRRPDEYQKKDVFDKCFKSQKSDVPETSTNSIHRVSTPLISAVINIFKGVPCVRKVRYLGHDLTNIVLVVEINF
jgi:hypothetical protein